MQVSKRNFLKGAAAAAAVAAVPAAQAKKRADLPRKWNITTDVVIVGYGGAGASAAITAADAGAKVMIFEKCATGGGNTAVSSGGMFIPNNEERAFTYLKKTYTFANSEIDEVQLRAFVKEAMKSKEFLLSLKPDQKVYIYGHAGFQSIPESDAVDKWRFRSTPGTKIRGGDMLFNNYRYAVETVRKVPVKYNARALELIRENDEVLGVWFEIEGKKVAVKARRGVVLATGGYEWDDVLLQNHTMGQNFHRLGHPGKIHIDQMAFIPARAKLHADGQGCVAHHRGDDLFCQWQIQQQSAAVPVPGDLVCRAAAIDIQAKKAVP